MGLSESERIFSLILPVNSARIQFNHRLYSSYQQKKLPTKVSILTTSNLELFILISKRKQFPDDFYDLIHYQIRVATTPVQSTKILNVQLKIFKKIAALCKLNCRKYNVKTPTLMNQIPQSNLKMSKFKFGRIKTVTMNHL